MALIKSIPEVNKTIEQLKNNDFGTITSTLTKRLGQENISRVESVVTRSFNEARSVWSYSSVPNNPKDTLWQFITDNSSDLFCRKVRNRTYPGSKFNKHSPVNHNYPDENEAVENKVTMLFACCHPAISDEWKLPLILKILGGYTTSYIARVLSKSETVISDQLKESKSLIIGKKIPFIIPEKFRLNERLEDILNNLHKLFELGFKPRSKKSKVIPELCFTALNLSETLASHNRTNTPETSALLALMLLNGSMLRSMTDSKEVQPTLKEQDRDLWDKNMIKRGIHFLYLSASGNNVSTFHLKAGIAAVHATSKNYNSTNWKQIIELYDNYLKLNGCPFIELKKVKAISKAYGAEKALESVNKINRVEELKSSGQFYSTLGNLYFQIHNYKTALENFKKALSLSQSPSDKSFFKSKIHICKQRINMVNKYKDGLSF